MVYISADGSLVKERSIIRFSFITDCVWGIINTIGMFFDTLINPTKPIPKRDNSSYGAGNGGPGGPGGPPRRPNIHGLPKASCTPKGG